jgi:ferritin-like metal-binding protein YciE
MLAAAQAVEHYEIARYGTLAAWAEKLGMKDAVKLLRTTLEEEKKTDMKPSELALSEINIEADEGDAATRSPGASKRSGSQASERRA